MEGLPIELGCSKDGTRRPKRQRSVDSFEPGPRSLTELFSFAQRHFDVLCSDKTDGGQVFCSEDHT